MKDLFFMPKKPLYKRVLVKVSGESLLGDRECGIEPQKARDLATEIKNAHELGVEVAVVIGAGNIFRGVSAAANGMDRTCADYMGMLAIIMNAVALQDAFNQVGVESRVLSAIPVTEICEPFIRLRALRHMEKGRIVVCAAGTGNPYFSTDTAASLRALELDCEVLMKATKVDGVYDKDPMKHKDAKLYKKISFSEALKLNLRVMDSTAFAMCRENQLPIRVFNLSVPGIIAKALVDDKVGTLVS